MDAGKAFELTSDMEESIARLLRREVVSGITEASAAGYIYQSEISPPQALVEAATIHEFGGMSMIENEMRPIPERSFLRRPFAEHKKKIKDEVKANLSKVLDGDKSVEDALAAIGILGRDVSLSSWNGEGWPELHPKTIKRKGHDTKLVDTGTLKASISYEVRDVA